MDSMARLSSRRTFFVKKVLPFAWIAILAFVFFAWMYRPRLTGRETILLPLLLSVIGLLIMPRFAQKLVDQVYDGGDHLVVVNDGVEDRIALADIMNVSVSQFTNSPRVTLRLTRPSTFGEEIAFIPVVDFWHRSFSRIKIADDLITRVDQARRGAQPRAS